MRVSWSFFSTLGVGPGIGRDFTRNEDVFGAERVVIISHQLWQRQFGADPALVGRTILLSGESYRVIGVMPAGFRACRAWYPSGTWR